MFSCIRNIYNNHLSSRIIHAVGIILSKCSQTIRDPLSIIRNKISILFQTTMDYSIIATTLAGAAEAPTIRNGKVATLNPDKGKAPRLTNCSI